MMGNQAAHDCGVFFELVCAVRRFEEAAAKDKQRAQEEKEAYEQSDNCKAWKAQNPSPPKKEKAMKEKGPQVKKVIKKKSPKKPSGLGAGVSSFTSVRVLPAAGAVQIMEGGRGGTIALLVRYKLCVYDVFHREGGVCVSTPLPVRCTRYTYDVSYREGSPQCETCGDSIRAGWASMHECKKTKAGQGCEP